MIASEIAAPPSTSLEPLHSWFLAIPPRIKTHAQIYFRHVNCCFKLADLVSGAIALA